MFSVILVAALTQSVPAGHGYSHHQYGANYGACYGVGYGGWYAGGWGLPYGGYWAGYSGWGGCGGYDSVAYGMTPMTVLPTYNHGPATYSGSDRDPVEEPRRRDNRLDRDDKLDRDDRLDRDDKLDRNNKLDRDDKLDKERLEKDDKSSRLRAPQAGERARLVVQLPEDAKLYVDDQVIANAAQKGAFSTPELSRGKKYYYELRAEVVRDGKPVVESRRVIVTAGSVIRADFSNLGASTGVATAGQR